MKGKQIYFTHQEIIALYLTIEDFEEKASETVYAQRLQNGLGTAWHKLKDCIDSRQLAKPINNDMCSWNSWDRFKEGESKGEEYAEGEVQIIQEEF